MLLLNLLLIIGIPTSLGFDRFSAMTGHNCIPPQYCINNNSFITFYIYYYFNIHLEFIQSRLRFLTDRKLHRLAAQLSEQTSSDVNVQCAPYTRHIVIYRYSI